MTKHIPVRLALFALLAAGTLSVPSVHGQGEPSVEVVQSEEEGGSSYLLNPPSFEDDPGEVEITVSAGESISMTTANGRLGSIDPPARVGPGSSWGWLYSYRRNEADGSHEDTLETGSKTTAVVVRLLTPGIYDFSITGIGGGAIEGYSIRVIVDEPSPLPAGRVSGKTTVEVDGSRNLHPGARAHRCDFLGLDGHARRHGSPPRFPHYLSHPATYLRHCVRQLRDRSRTDRTRRNRRRHSADDES